MKKWNEIVLESIQYKVGMKVLVKDVQGKDQWGMIKSISKESDLISIAFGSDVYGISPSRILKIK